MEPLRYCNVFFLSMKVFYCEGCNRKPVLSRHGGVQPGESPRGFALVHGAHSPGHLSRQIESAARTPTAGQSQRLPEHPIGHRNRETSQVVSVYRAGSEVPVLVSGLAQRLTG